MSGIDQRLNGKVAVITGASRGIGKQAALRLAKHGAEVVIAADSVSASRPGGRGESLEHYIKRLEALEEIANSKRGVDRVYAMQAGREVRVMVKPEEVDDDTAALLSHEIAREIEGQLEYPGQIKVTVIRESRAVDVAH